MNEFISWEPCDKEGNYLISKEGKVYSKKSKRVLKPFLTCGYKEVYIYEDGKRKHSRIHILVAKAYIPNPLDKPIVNHKDGDKLNNNVSNLEWATHKENSVHANRNNLIKRVSTNDYSWYKGDKSADISKMKKIEGYTYYYATECGKIYSTKCKRYMKPYTHLSGYNTVTLTLSGKCRSKMIHRLIAKAYVPNPDEKPLVNHINGNKTDNRIENLEWCTYAENTQHASDTGLIDHSVNFKPVIQYNINHEEIARYKSIKEADEKTNVSRSKISAVCSGKRKHAGGYVWRYEDNPILDLRFPGAKQIYNTVYILLPDKRIYSVVSDKFRPRHIEPGSRKLYCRITKDKVSSRLYLKDLVRDHFGDGC